MAEIGQSSHEFNFSKMLLATSFIYVLETSVLVLHTITDRFFQRGATFEKFSIKFGNF